MVLLVPLALIFLGLALPMALRLIYGARGASDDDSFFFLGKIASRCLLGAGLLAWTGLPMLFAVPLWILVAFAVVESVLAARQSSRRINSKLLAIAAQEQNLTEAARLLDEVSAGRYVGEAARGLVYQLHQGTPLYESIASNPGALPREAAAYAAIGSLGNASVEALNELSRPEDTQWASSWRRWCTQAAYGTVVVMSLGTILTLCLVFIVPQFESIFSEFGLSLPPMLELLIVYSGAATFGRLLYSLLFLLCAGLCIAVPVVAVFYLVDVPILRKFSDWLLRRKHTASALRMLALAVEKRVDMARAFYALSVTHPAKVLKSRLSDCYQDVTSGQKWADVMVHNALLSANEKALVETAEQAGNLPWALRQIAHRRESQLATRLAATSNVAYPLTILAIGIVIGLVVISLFAPLVKLVEALS